MPQNTSHIVHCNGWNHKIYLTRVLRAMSYCVRKTTFSSSQGRIDTWRRQFCLKIWSQEILNRTSLLGIGGKYIGVHLNQYNGLLYSQHCSSLWMVWFGGDKYIGVHLNKYTGLIYFVDLWCLWTVGWLQFLNQTPCMNLFVLSSFLVRVVTSTIASSTFLVLNNYFILKTPCWKIEYPKRFF
jgi:hypothetical protein